MHVDITCGVTEKEFVSLLAFLLTVKKDFKMIFLNWKGNRKEQLEEALYNLSSVNVYLLYVSFCPFHENFGLN